MATILTLIIFIATYILIISEKVHQTVASMFGGILLILLGIMHQEEAISSIDFNTLGLLVGMMIIIEIIKGTGLFQYLAIKAAKIAKGKPITILIYLSIVTAIASAFLDNVTTILMVLPLTFIIADTLGVSSVPFLMSQILISNIGGASTLIGDPPNILIGSAAKFGFNDFIFNVSPVVIFVAIVTITIFYFIYRKELVVPLEVQQRILEFSPSKLLENLKMIKRSVFVLGITIIGFVFHQQFSLEAATVALGGAGLLLIITNEHPAKILKEVEWPTIFFVIGIFVLVSGIEKVGIIEMLSNYLIKIVAGDISVLTIIILWVGGIGSAFLGNIPFVVTMIPVVKHIEVQTGLSVDPLWWALALGSCLGGNGNLFGSAANIAAVNIYKNSGKNFSFLDFFKVGFPIMLVSLGISTIYIYWFLI